MPTESFKTSTIVPGRAEQIYDAWIDGRQHGAFTNEEAESDPRVGGSYTAGTGYMGGKYLALEPGRRVLQSWRTTEFPKGSRDSRLEVLFEDVKGGTRVTLNHSDIPAGQGERYREGWATYYFEPMQAYFGSRFGKAPVAKKAAQGPASELITARIRELGDWRGEKLALVRKLIHQADPAILEEWKWKGTPVWSHDGIVCTGESYKQLVKLTFAKGALLADPHHLFNSGLTGNVRRVIDLRAEDEIDGPSFRALIREAVAFNQDHPPKRRRS